MVAGKAASLTQHPSSIKEGMGNMYECFHCGHRAVVWDADFDFSDFCLEGEGIVHVCHCSNCGAEIEYRIAIPDPEEDEE